MQVDVVTLRGRVVEDCADVLDIETTGRQVSSKKMRGLVITERFNCMDTLEAMLDMLFSPLLFERGLPAPGSCYREARRL